MASRTTQVTIAVGVAAVLATSAYTGATFMQRNASTPRAETCWLPEVKANVSGLVTQEFFADAEEAFGEARENAPDIPAAGKRLWVTSGGLQAVTVPSAVGVGCAAIVGLRIKRANDSFAHLDGVMIPYQVTRGETGWAVTIQPSSVKSALQEVLGHGAQASTGL